jgi:hypothetical protein
LRLNELKSKRVLIVTAEKDGDGNYIRGAEAKPDGDVLIGVKDRPRRVVILASPARAIRSIKESRYFFTKR